MPFTPATGRRLLARPGHEADGRAALIQGALTLAQRSGVSSLHITFCTAEERTWGAELGLLPRTTQQFHWQNRGYADFDGTGEAVQTVFGDVGAGDRGGLAVGGGTALAIAFTGGLADCGGVGHGDEIGGTAVGAL